MEKLGLFRAAIISCLATAGSFAGEPAVKEPAVNADRAAVQALGKETADVAAGRSQLTVDQIIDRANKVLRGESSHALITMTIVTPNWSRALDIEGWNEGREKAFIVIHSPPKDKGNTTLRRKNEMWLWMPKVERVMKIPPTMMHASWQGSDFTYEDIVKADSIVKDYVHTEVARKAGDGYITLKIRCDPKPDAPVVWGKVLSWCRVYSDGGVVPIREEDYSERGELVRTIQLSEIETMQSRHVPTLLECVPQRKPGQKTSIKYRKIEFDVSLPDSFFSLSRLQRLGE